MTSWKPTPSSGPTRWGSPRPWTSRNTRSTPLINMKMNRDRLGPTVCQMATLNTPPRAVRDCEQPGTCAPRVAPSCLFCESPPGSPPSYAVGEMHPIHCDWRAPLFRTHWSPIYHASALLMSADNSPLAIAASFSTFDHGCTGTGLVSDDEEGRCGFAPAFFVVW